MPLEKDEDLISECETRRRFPSDSSDFQVTVPLSERDEGHVRFGSC